MKKKPKFVLVDTRNINNTNEVSYSPIPNKHPAIISYHRKVVPACKALASLFNAELKNGNNLNDFLEVWESGEGGKQFYHRID